MSRNLELFGTEQPPVPTRAFSVGDLSFNMENGALRHIKLNGSEAIRGIAFLVRDRDWGTLAPQISNEEVTQTQGGLRISYNARFISHMARLDVEIVIEACTSGLTMTAVGQTQGVFETNRAGFTVLHPINDVAGRPVRVDHSDGTSVDAHFPALIEPWQPFMEIAGLTHQVADQSVTCKFVGDTFEMEDHRQWGDASYKTYNRPLALPWPYEIEDGAALTQSVELTWKAAKPLAARPFETAGTNAVFPQISLVISPEDALRLADKPADLAHVNPQRLLCHLDATLPDTAGQFTAFAKAQAACPQVEFDLELIGKCDADPAPEMVRLAAEMAEAGFAPASVFVCPWLDRQSTPPGSEWPACPPLELVHSAAAKAFPNVTRGGGMFTFFPELNRKRPPVEMLDFIGHGLCPIVHAADDLSVMETLETIPHITRSAKTIIGDRPYRIGPSTIAMRQNPYGARTIPNPAHERICMADDDPRHRGKFGAAYLVGLAGALVPAGISVWTPASLYGTRGVVTLVETWPITKALHQIARLAGQPVGLCERDNGIARLCVGETELVANLTDVENDGLGPFEWRVT